MRTNVLLACILSLLGACSGDAAPGNTAPAYAGTYYGRLEGTSESREVTVNFDAKSASVTGYDGLSVSVNSDGSILLGGGTVSYHLVVQSKDPFLGRYEKRKPDSNSLWTGNWSLAKMSKVIITTDQGEVFYGFAKD